MQIPNADEMKTHTYVKAQEYLKQRKAKIYQLSCMQLFEQIEQKLGNVEEKPLSILGRLKKYMDQHKQDDNEALLDPDVSEAQKQRIKNKINLSLKCNAILIKLYKLDLDLTENKEKALEMMWAPKEDEGEEWSEEKMNEIISNMKQDYDSCFKVLINNLIKNKEINFENAKHAAKLEQAKLEAERLQKLKQNTARSDYKENIMDDTVPLIDPEVGKRKEDRLDFKNNKK